MDTLIQADIFFFVTTAAVVVIAIALLIALIYVILILRDFSQVSKKVKEESSEIIDDIKTLRGSLKKEGVHMRFFTNFFSTLFKRRKK